MLIPQKHIVTCFDKVREVTESYKLLFATGGSHTLKSVSTLIHAVTPILKGRLEVLELNVLYSVAEARGFFLVDTANDYKIVLLSGQNTCWSRLVLCKELFHVLLDSEASRNICVAEHLDDYLYSFPDHETVPSKGVISEWQAEFAAMEFLFPFKDRLMILEKNYVSSDIAQRYMVPKVMVEKYLSESYMQNMKQFF